MKIRRLSFLLALLTVFSMSSCGAAENRTADATAAGEFSPTADAVGGASEGGIIAKREDYSADDIGTAAGAEGGDFEYEYPADGVTESVMDSETFGDAAIEGVEKSEASERTEIFEEDYSYDDVFNSQSQAGLLTSGEWNDNENFDFWKNLISSRQDWSGVSYRWGLDTSNRIAVNIKSESGAAEGVKVKLMSGTTVLWESVSDNKGNAYLFDDFKGNDQFIPTQIIAEKDGVKLAEVEYKEGDTVGIDIKDVTKNAPSLDLMFVVDTTGSMGDELNYLQTELTDIVERVAAENQIPVRVSVNFYRDTTDQYVVRSFDFTNSVGEAVRNIQAQSANGGGDYAEAVEQALEDAVYNHSWNEDSTKLMFLVLDAPPHYSNAISQKLGNVLAKASEEGIRVIPVASSGVDTETEYLCRTFSIATGGTYTFLTDHSGVGGSHLEPTVGHYQVEKLNDMIVRIIGEYIG